MKLKSTLDEVPHAGAASVAGWLGSHSKILGGSAGVLGPAGVASAVGSCFFFRTTLGAGDILNVVSVVGVGKMVEMQYGSKRMCDKFAKELECSSRG